MDGLYRLIQLLVAWQLGNEHDVRPTWSTAGGVESAVSSAGHRRIQSKANVVVGPLASRHNHVLQHPQWEQHGLCIVVANGEYGDQVKLRDDKDVLPAISGRGDHPDRVTSARLHHKVPTEVSVVLLGAETS